MNKKWLVTLFGIAVSVVAIVWIARHTELQKTIAYIADAGFALPLALVAIYLCTFPIRAQRWQWMLPQGTLRFSQALKGNVLGFAGNNFLPARGGEFLRMEYLHRSAPHVGRVTAISSILVERMLDGLTLLAILVVSLSCSHIALEDHPALSKLPWVALGIFGMAFVGAVAIRIWGTAIAAMLCQFHARPCQWAARLIERFHVATEFLGFNGRTVAAIFAGFAVWIIEGAVYAVACWHYGLGPQSIVAGYLTLAIANFGMLIPSTPGNFGVYQGLVIVSLGLFGVSEDRALAMSIVLHACFYVPTTAWGAAILLHESWLRAERRAAAAITSEVSAPPAFTPIARDADATPVQRPHFDRPKKRPVSRP